MMDMFPNTRSVLDEFENTYKKAVFEPVTDYEEDVIFYFSVNLAKALMKDTFIEADKVVKIILATKDLSSEITVKIQ